MNQATSPAGAKDPSRQEYMAAQRETLIARVDELAPTLSKHAAEGDSALCLSQPVIDAITEAGLFRLWQPQRYNGLEVDVATQMTVSAEIAKYCGSSGWVTALYGACCWFACLYDAETQDEVFGTDENARVCGVLAPMASVTKVKDGIKVDGKWPYASGSEHATWATVGAPRVNGEPGVDLLLIPMHDLSIERSWDPTGMRGTASNTLHGNGVFVPERRVLPFFCVNGALDGQIASPYYEALYHTPLGGFASACVFGPLLGMAKAALELTLTRIVDRPVAYTFAQDQSALVSTQLALADVATNIDSAELHALRAAHDLDLAAEHRMPMDLRLRARIRHDVGHATTLLRDAMHTLQQVAGSSDMTRGREFERVWRDFSTASLHAVLSSTTTGEVYGKTLCGHDPTTFSGVL